MGKTEEKSALIERLFDEYLDKVYGKKKTQMPPVQYTEIKRSFVAGMGQMMAHFFLDVKYLTEDDWLKEVDEVLMAVQYFFKNESEMDDKVLNIVKGKGNNMVN